MKQISRKKKIWLSLLGLILVFFFFLSSLTRVYVLNNSKELLGRKLEIAELHFNYAKVAVRINDFHLYEQNDIDEFVSFDELYVNVSLWKLFSGEYSLSQIYLDGLKLSVIQDSLGFNFDDLMPDTEELVDSTAVEEKSEDLKFSIYNIEFKNGYIAYFDKDKDNLLDLNDINLALPLIAWDNQKSEMGVDFSLGSKGNVSIQADIDHATERYELSLGVSSLDISPFKAYLEDYMNISSMSGEMNTSLKINGSMIDFMDVFVKGDASLQNLSMLDIDENKFLATKSASVILDSLNIGSSHYQIGQIQLQEPEIYASLDKDNTNFERVFEPLMAVDSTEISIDTTTIEESDLFYSVDSIVVEGGFVQFTDKTLNRDFVYDIKDIILNLGTITEMANDIPLNYSLNLTGGGKSEGSLSFNLQDVYDIDFTAKVSGLELMSFSPYTEFYIARPITQGTFTYSGELKMTSASMNNMNQFRISEVEFGDKTNNPDAIKAPVRLALYLLKDKDDNIEFELPVTGNPSDPEFKLNKIIWKTLLKFLVKTATKPFGMLGNLIGSDPESIQTIPFRYDLDSLSVDQKKSLSKIAEILKKKPELKFILTQETDVIAEKDLLAVHECSDLYYKLTLPERISLFGDDFTNWAEGNLEFMNVKSQDDFHITLPLKEKCYKVIGEKQLSILHDSILVGRNRAFFNYLKDSLQVQESNFTVKTADLINLSDQQKDPKYRLEVSLK